MKNILFLNDKLYASVCDKHYYYTNNIIEINYDNSSNIICQTLENISNYELFIDKDANQNIIQYGSKILDTTSNYNRVIKTNWGNYGDEPIKMPTYFLNFDVIFPGCFIGNGHGVASLSQYRNYSFPDSHCRITDDSFIYGQPIRVFETTPPGYEGRTYGETGGFYVSYENVANKSKNYMYSIFVKKVESYEAKNTYTYSETVNTPLLYLGPGINGYKSTRVAEDTILILTLSKLKKWN